MPTGMVSIDQVISLLQATKGLPSSTPTAIYGHGTGGLFSNPTVSQAVVNAMMLPTGGLASMIPMGRGSVIDNVIWQFITGVGEATGSNPDGPCDDPPTAGVVRSCSQALTFGKLPLQSRVLDITQVGRYANAGDPTNLQMVGSPFAGGSRNPLVPAMGGESDFDQMLNNEIAKAMFELAGSYVLKYGRLTYTGNPANNTNGGYAEFSGLDLQINTGKVDSISNNGTPCPAIDSIVVDFGGADVATNGATLVATIASVIRRIKHRAENTGLAPVELVLAMREDLFYEVSAAWPCAYMTAGCANLVAGATQFVSSDTQIQMRDEMRMGRFLWVDGMRVKVVDDPNIPETEPVSGTYQSGIRVVPMTIQGGIRRAIFWDYFRYDTPNGPMRAAQMFAPDGMFQTSDAGMFLWHKKPANNFCVQLAVLTEPRLILETPQLAAHIQNIRYTPLAHTQSAYPSEDGYAAGGVTAR